MACEPVRRPRLLFAALVAVLVALWIPATGHAAERDEARVRGALERGSGYQSAGGSRRRSHPSSAAFGGWATGPARSTACTAR